MLIAYARTSQNPRTAEPDEKQHGKERRAQLVVVPHLPHQLGIADHVRVVPRQLEHQTQCDHNEHRIWIFVLEPFFRLGADGPYARNHASRPLLLLLFVVVVAGSGRGWRQEGFLWCLFLAEQPETTRSPRRHPADHRHRTPASIMASTESALLSMIEFLFFRDMLASDHAVVCRWQTLGWIAMSGPHASMRDERHEAYEANLCYYYHIIYYNSPSSLLFLIYYSSFLLQTNKKNRKKIIKTNGS